MLAAPHIEIGITIGAILIKTVGYMVPIRINPYPPSFNRILAKTMDPAAGAST